MNDDHNKNTDKIIVREGCPAIIASILWHGSMGKMRIFPLQYPHFTRSKHPHIRICRDKIEYRKSSHVLTVAVCTTRKCI